MRVEVVRFRELTRADIAAWEEIRTDDQRFGSPYFSPGFTRSVDLVRSDVFVARLGDGKSAAGFFPFQRSCMGIARPVGGALSDYHGVIIREEEVWDARDLLAQCGIRYFPFDHLIASQAEFSSFIERVEESPVIDLSSGLDAYLEEQRVAGSKQWKKVGNFRRRLGREHGEVRFVSDLRDRAAMETLLEWKSAQCVACGGVDFTRFAWVRALLEELWTCQAPEFRGVLSGLYAGDTLVAAHFGIISGGTWHYWFPGYRKAMSKCSPGLVLLAEILVAAEAEGVSRVDMGKGDDPYKGRWSNAGTQIAEGSVVNPSVVGGLVGAYRGLNGFLAGRGWDGTAQLMNRFSAVIGRRWRFR